jgi:transcription elongation factor Elf1
MLNELPVSDATVVAAEGARIGIVTCMICGAAILIDPRDERSAVALHSEWHPEVSGNKG